MNKFIQIFSIIIVFLLNVILIYANIKMQQDRGMSMGVGFLNLLFLIIFFPIGINFWLSKPNRIMWFYMILLIVLFVYMLFK